MSFIQHAEEQVGAFILRQFPNASISYAIGMGSEPDFANRFQEIIRKLKLPEGSISCRLRPAPAGETNTNYNLRLNGVAWEKIQILKGQSQTQRELSADEYALLEKTVSTPLSDNAGSIQVKIAYGMLPEDVAGKLEGYVSTYNQHNKPHIERAEPPRKELTLPLSLARKLADKAPEQLVTAPSESTALAVPPTDNAAPPPGEPRKIPITTQATPPEFTFEAQAAVRPLHYVHCKLSDAPGKEGTKGFGNFVFHICCGQSSYDGFVEMLHHRLRGADVRFQRHQMDLNTCHLTRLAQNDFLPVLQEMGIDVNRPGLEKIHASENTVSVAWNTARKGKCYFFPKELYFDDRMQQQLRRFLSNMPSGIFCVVERRDSWNILVNSECDRTFRKLIGEENIVPDRPNPVIDTAEAPQVADSKIVTLRSWRRDAS